MKFALLAAAVALLPVSFQDTATFKDDQLNLVFDHPSTWKVDKRTKRSTTIKIPIEGSSDEGSLEVIRASFRSDADVWQTIQARSAEIGKRTMVRQWEQQVLGTPLLLTQLEFSQGGVQKTELTGLFYSKSPLKMLFKLTVPTAAYETTQYQFQRTLETLRTIDGNTPTADDPTAPLPVAPAKPEPVRPKKVLSDGSDRPKPVTAPLTTELTVSTRKVTLRYPEGWSATDVQENGLVLKNGEVAGPVTVKVFSTLDSDAPLTALFKLSSASLADYKKVEKREDADPRPNKAGATVSYVWRKGTAANGDLMTMEAYGQSGEHYFLASYRLTDPLAYASERKALEALLSQMSLEVAP